jgi:hypothetical protein
VTVVSCSLVRGRWEMTNLEDASVGLEFQVSLSVLELRLLLEDAYEAACSVPDGLADRSHDDGVGRDQVE